MLWKLLFVLANLILLIEIVDQFWRSGVTILSGTWLSRIRTVQVQALVI